jgi:biopolymer transport protein ExbB
MEERRMKKSTWIIGLLTVAGIAFAQETAAPAASGSGLASQDSTLWDLIVMGGWCMWPLGLCSFLAVVFVVQNFFSLRPKVLLHTEMVPELLEMMLQKRVREALIYCRKNPTMFTNILAAGLERCLDSQINFGKVRDAVDEASVEQVTQLMKPIDWLSIIGPTSTMLGLLGTVSGMIKAFQTMGVQGMGKPELLASNIGEALITTAAGLIIAIPSMAFYFFFKKGFAKTIASMGRNLGHLFDALETGKKPLNYMDTETLEKMGGK